MNNIDFHARATVQVPTWATAIRLVANGIDGWAPYEDRTLDVPTFLAIAPTLQLEWGAGEWDVLVYAVSDPKLTAERHPYGPDHPYRQLRSRNGSQVRQIAVFSYMAWNFYTFTA